MAEFVSAPHSFVVAEGWLNLGISSRVCPRRHARDDLEYACAEPHQAFKWVSVQRRRLQFHPRESGDRIGVDDAAEARGRSANFGNGMRANRSPHARQETIRIRSLLISDFCPAPRTRDREEDKRRTRDSCERFKGYLFFGLPRRSSRIISPELGDSLFL